MVRLVLEGVDQFEQALAQLPPTFAERAHGIVYTSAAYTRDELRRTYPPRRPTSRSRFEPLRDVWSVQGRDKGPLHARAQVIHREILAQWYEEGTKDRVTRQGWARGRMHGKVPVAPVFVPIVMRNRRIMNEALVQLAESVGLTVTRG